MSDDKPECVPGVFNRVHEAEIAEARYKAGLAKLRLAPHLVYGAKVWRSGLTEPGKQWCCGLVYNEDWRPYVGTIYSPPVDPQQGAYLSWVMNYPMGYGDTPEKACEDFDHLWKHGDEVDPAVGDDDSG